MFSRASWRVLLSLLLLTVLTVWSVLLYRDDDRLHVYIFDVGQGDSILVKSGNFEILVDGGPDESVVNWLGRTLPPWDRTIEVVVLTHPHADHVKGLVEVFKRYEVEEVWGTGVVHTSEVYIDFLETIRQKAIHYEVVSAGYRQTREGINIEVLAPTHSLQGVRLDNANLSSIVLKASFGQFAILLTGDAEEPIQEELVGRGVDLASDILKVPHQGSRDADLPAFLEAVRPALAVISVGQGNTYGHPHAEVLRRYESLAIPILRTDQDGTVEIATNGTDAWIEAVKTGIISEMNLSSNDAN